MTRITELTKEDPGNEGVCVVAVLAICDIAETDDVHLHLGSTAGCIHRKQDRPCDQATEEAKSDGDFQVTQEEEGVEGVVIEHIAIGDLIERANPVEESTWQVWGSLSVVRLSVDAPWKTQLD